MQLSFTQRLNGFGTTHAPLSNLLRIVVENVENDRQQQQVLEDYDYCTQIIIIVVF